VAAAGEAKNSANQTFLCILVMSVLSTVLLIAEQVKTSSGLKPALHNIGYRTGESALVCNFMTACKFRTAPC
jgi:hypothetical protein